MTGLETATLMLGIWGSVTGTLALALGRWDRFWNSSGTRLHGILEPLRDLEGPVLNAMDPRQLANLYSVTSSSHAATLQQEAATIPGPITRRRVKEIGECVTAVIGSRQPDQSDGTLAPVTPQQRERLDRAAKLIRKVLKRYDRAARRSGVAPGP